MNIIMKISPITTILIFILAVSCSKNSQTMKALALIDSLQSNQRYDSAYNEMARFDTSNIKTDGERAYYYLLNTEIMATKNKTTNNDSVINYSIRYYEKHGDNRKLAYAYYYKGVYLADKGDNIGSMASIKKAENAEKKVGIPMLRYLINVNMAYLNTEEGANKTGLEYARKALADAQAAKSANLTCLALNNIAMCHYYMGNKDSAWFYIEKTKRHAYKIPTKEDRAVILSNIGVTYYDNGMYSEADTLFRQAIELLPVSTTQINLAKNNYALGNDDKTDSLLTAAWVTADYEEKAEILYFLSERAEDKGDLKTSSKLYKQGKIMQDSAKMDKDTEEAITTQQAYDMEKKEEETSRKEMMAGVIIIIAIAILAAVATRYHQKKINKAKKAIADNGMTIKELTAKVDELERADRKHSHEADALRRKIRKLKDEQNEILGRGQRLYDDITAGGNTATWKKQDFDEFIEFYRVSHPDVVADAEDNYRRLSSTNIFYLILTDMGHGDDDAQRIMCMTAGALRTMKSRINGKRKNA